RAPLRLQSFHFALVERRSSQQLAEQLERFPQLVGEGGDRDRGNVPVGVRVDRGTNSLEAVGDGRSVGRRRALEQELHRELRESGAAWRIRDRARLRERRDRDDRKL